MLELKNIEKSYKIGKNFQKVLKGINIKFRNSEFVSILGSSGSGKTTLLNIIGGLDKYDYGDLIVDGKSTKEYKDKDWDSYRNHCVGFVFQSYNLINHQSVLENVEISLRLSGISPQKRKKLALEALKKVGLEEHIYKKPSELSGGQMQRVAIARAIINNPEIILADEPTGALDSKTSIQIMDLLKKISKDKLVIMVTHNSEIAKKYSSRIIELKDGIIEKDNNEYIEKDDICNEKKLKKTSMSLLSALSLSFNNLMTKKGRTLLTAFAGSIGIIGIALIISLSNGVNSYAKKLEKESLSDFPITFERENYDIFETLAAAFSDEEEEIKCPINKICSKDDIVESYILSNDKGLLKKNNLRELKKYIEKNDDFKKYSSAINYIYNIDLQVYTKDYVKVNPSNLIGESESNLFSEINPDVINYEILSGRMPNDYNEVVLVLNSDGIISDSLLYSLNIKDRKHLAKDFEKIRKDNKYRVESTEYNYDDILNREYKVILNTDYYREENGKFIDNSNNLEYLKHKIDSAIEIKIVGVVKSDSATNSIIGYSHDLTMKIINEISKTNIYKKQIENKNINVLTNEAFDDILNSYDNIAQKLGIYEEDNPSAISIYPKDYDSKQKIADLIEEYNANNKNNNHEELVVSYSDVMKSLVDGITKAINAISFVLIGFVAISLIVSSIMISIITYISVLERTKEIGILRAIGASKKDIKRVFRAETIIEGLIAGILGVGLALFISIPINSIVYSTSEIEKIASLPLGSAIFLIALSVILNVIAGSKPSNIAAKKNPVEALREE